MIVTTYRNQVKITRPQPIINNRIPLSEPEIRGNEWKYVKECLDTAWVSGAGQFVDEFEKKICEYTGAKYAITCVNGTSGLQVSLRLSGVKENDEVIVPTLTFIAPVNCIKYLAAEPVFMDCDQYLNIDVNKLEEFCKKECRVTNVGLKNKRTNRIIKAILPVHIFGNPCDMEKIMAIARSFNLKVVEDAAESFGSYYTSGRYRSKFTGTIGDFGVYSFNGNKIITTGGGGAIVTNDRTNAKKVRYLINQAKDDPIKYIHREIGYNFRLSNLQAALGLAQIEQLSEFIRIKRENYLLYKKLLNNIKGIKLMDIPQGTNTNYWFYSIIIDEKEYGMGRDQLRECLSKKNIETRPIWRLSHLQQPYLNNQVYKIQKALWFWRSILNIPSSSNLKSIAVKKIANEIKSLSRSEKCKK